MELSCEKIKKCCIHNENCEGIKRIWPNGHIEFVKCGC